MQPRRGRPPKGKERGETKQTQFRLSVENLAELDAIAAALTEEQGTPFTRSDAVRVSIRKEYERIKRRKGVGDGAD